MEHLIGHLIAAKVDTGRWSVQLITVRGIESDGRIKIFWDTGPSGCSLSLERFKVLYDYGIPEKDNDDWWNNVDLHFLKTYYPAKPCEPRQSEDGGFYSWISPDGDFYHCNYGDHDSTARSIYTSLNNKVLPDYEAREILLKTWVQLSGVRGVYGRWDTYDLTPKQYETIKSINKKFSLSFNLRNGE